MKIITIDSPWRGKSIEENEWVCKTKMYPEKCGGVRQWFKDMEDHVNNYPFIYLYDIKALSQMIGGTEPEIIYYIRWAYPKLQS